MILDRISNANLYALGENFNKAFEYLKNTDLATAELGRYEIDGTDIFALVQEYPTKTIENCSAEAHENYADIQYVVKGREKMGYAPLDTLKITQAYNPEKDLAKYSGTVDWFVVNEGMFAVFFPQDGHEPCLAVENGDVVRKVVVKIKVK